MLTASLRALPSITVFAGLMSMVLAVSVLRDEDFFNPNDEIESIRVELVVAAGGEDLDEPIALDLGLGFPLWLHRLGQDESAIVPFGAVSQTGTDSHAIQAGERATFEFNLNEDSGYDKLRTTRQLLAGVRVSDISRVGFTSKADHGWIVQSYAIQINGKPFFKNDSVNANGRGCQDQARDRLMELNREPDAELQELQDLRALVQTDLAQDAERERLTELEKTMAAKVAEVDGLERQLRGAAPFYDDSGFQPSARANSKIEKVKVTLVTAPHTGASTRNYVYFRIGGHKYLLGSAVSPLSPDSGPQEFTLDLITAPLAASDLRGYALGVLAPQVPMGNTPDRWHPQRLRVEVDDRLVYDSEDNSLDRASLAAIRLIPPAHLNYQGNVVKNQPNAREAFVWQSGSGAGLDLVHGGADALPPADDPKYPHAEPELVVNQDIDIDIDQQQNSWYDPLAEPFPGETAFGPNWQPGWQPGGSPWLSGGWTPDWQSGWNNGWGPGASSGPNPLDLLLAVLNSQGGLPAWVIPNPIGTPPQLEQVTVDYGTQTIHWSVTGDDSQIDHFVIDRVLIRPDLPVPIVEVIGSPYPVGAGQRSLPWTDLPPITQTWTLNEATRSFIAYRVTMIPTDLSLGVDPGLSPAAPLHPMNPMQFFQVENNVEFIPVGGLPVNTTMIVGTPAMSGPATWRAGESVTHSAITLAALSPLQHHIVARAQSDGDQTTIEITGILPPGKYRMLGYLGFVGAVEQLVAVQMSSVVHLQSITNPALQLGVPAGVVTLSADPTVAPPPLSPVLHELDTNMVGPGSMNYRATYSFHHTTVDPQHPPALFGLRLVEM